MKLAEPLPAWVALGLAVALGALARPARAHAVGLSRGDYVLVGDGTSPTLSERGQNLDGTSPASPERGRNLAVVTAELRFARSDAVGLDADALLRGVQVSMNGTSCP